MYVHLGLVKEVLPNLTVSPVLKAWHVLVYFSHVVHDVHDIFGSTVQVWNFSVVKDIVNIFKECLDNYLCVVKQENCCLLINTAAHEKFLPHVISPGIEIVSL